MAEALWLLRGGRARLLASLGDDADGRLLAAPTPGLFLDGCIIPGARTASYSAVLDADGECKLGLGDMSIHDHISVELVNKHIDVLEKAPLVVVDGNVPQATMDHVLQLCNQMKKPVFFEPTDRRKALKSLHSRLPIAYASPNIAELRAMATFLRPNHNFTVASNIDEILRLSVIVAEVVEFLLVTLGSKGALTVRHSTENKLSVKLYPVNIVNSVKSVSGAGDCFASGFICGVLSGFTEPGCISLGIKSAKEALLSESNIPSTLIHINNIGEAEFEVIL